MHATTKVYLQLSMLLEVTNDEPNGETLCYSSMHTFCLPDTHCASMKVANGCTAKRLTNTYRCIWDWAVAVHLHTQLKDSCHNQTNSRSIHSR